MSDQVELINELEQHSGGPLASARLLCVDYTGSYAKWKTRRKSLPRYIRSSMLAHIALFKLNNSVVKEHVNQ